MPATLTSPSSSHTANKAAATPRDRTHSKKTRIVRRRGRAKHAIESDDEIEREVGSDSDSENDLSSLDSASDSDTEPASEDVAPNGHSRVLIPSTSEIPEVGTSDKDSVAHMNGDHAAFFTNAGNWSEMVADENANGPADLPVINFSEFDGQIIPPRGARSHRVKKPVKTGSPVSQTASLPPARFPAAEEHDEEPEDVEPVASTSRHSSEPSPLRRPAGQTARQAYQQRLETDPSYVPTVGEFWGHDDRLLDKDLRSLSGWWRGRWQGHGRGRGGFDRGFPMRGRGRGGFFGPQTPLPSQSAPETTGPGIDAQSKPPPDVPPIDRAWTHDGFEEMKRKEEHHRRPQQQQSQPPQPTRGFGGIRDGRAGFVPGRGRGGFFHGGFTPTRSRVPSPFVPPGRVWFAMKPELMWTKQHDGFLHFDPALKPRYGQGAGFRVKLPGDRAQIVRAPLRSQTPAPASIAKPATASVLGSEYGEKSFVVRLPKRAGKEQAMEDATATLSIEESVTTIEDPPIDDIFTVRPRLVVRNPIPLSQLAVNDVSDILVPPSDAFFGGPSKQTESTLSSVTASSQGLPEAAAQQQLEQLSMKPQEPDSARRVLAEEAVLRNLSTAEDPTKDDQQPPSSASEQRPPLPPLQTVFTPPVSQTSPPYGSPYPYAPALPPGIAMNQHGMPYELATGRPVYLQPPPPPMYNPRPVMHSHMEPPSIPFVPGHIHHHSTASPDFLALPPSHTPPINGFIDPSNGIPIFSFPRQTSRIEIRAPTEQSEVGKSSGRRPSGLRTTAATFEPSRPSDDAVQGYFPSVSGPDMETLTPFAHVNAADGIVTGEEGQTAQHSQAVDPALMGYSPYPQQYYYPEAYGYPTYMDMSQVGQYEMYPSEPQAPQGTVYY